MPEPIAPVIKEIKDLNAVSVRYPNETPGPVEETFRDKGFAILGEHGADAVYTEGNSIRVRFFIGSKVVEEDLPIPEAKTMQQLIEEMCENRLKELKVK